MSLILDALKRAERERQGDTTPAPREAPAMLVRPGPLHGRGRGIAGAAAVVVGLGIAAALLWDAFRTTPAPEAIPPVVQQAPQPPKPAVIMARPAPPEAPAVVPGTESVASLDDLTDEASLEAPAPRAQAPARPAEPPRATPPPAGAAQKPASPAATATPKAEPRSAPPAMAAVPAQPEATPAPPSEIPPALTQPAPLRKFREMPPDYRADFPALKIEIHVYEKQPQRRFVMVNGRKYREGERLAEGPQLIEIVPDGIVLDYRGEKVLYTLGR